MSIGLSKCTRTACLTAWQLLPSRLLSGCFVLPAQPTLCCHGDRGAREGAEEGSDETLTCVRSAKVQSVMSVASFLPNSLKCGHVHLVYTWLHVSYTGCRSQRHR